MHKIAFLCMKILPKMANSVQSYNFLLIFTHFIRKNQLCKVDNVFFNGDNGLNGQNGGKS